MVGPPHAIDDEPAEEAEPLTPRPVAEHAATAAVRTEAARGGLALLGLGLGLGLGSGLGLRVGLGARV